MCVVLPHTTYFPIQGGQFMQFQKISTPSLKDLFVKELENKILETLNLNNLFNKDITYISNARQLEKINFAIKALDEALTTIENEATIDFVDIDIRKAWLYLGEIVGQTSTDNLLDELFSKFCLGK